MSPASLHGDIFPCFSAGFTADLQLHSPARVTVQTRDVIVPVGRFARHTSQLQLPHFGCYFNPNKKTFCRVSSIRPAALWVIQRDVVTETSRLGHLPVFIPVVAILRRLSHLRMALRQQISPSTGRQIARRLAAVPTNYLCNSKAFEVAFRCSSCAFVCARC